MDKQKILKLLGTIFTAEELFTIIKLVNACNPGVLPNSDGVFIQKLSLAQNMLLSECFMEDNNEEKINKE